MIEEALELLRLDEWYGRGEHIEIAKGKNKRVTSIKDIINSIKRAYKWQTRKR